MRAAVNEANQREYGKLAPENNEIDGGPLRPPGSPHRMKFSIEKLRQSKRLVLAGRGLRYSGDTEFAPAESVGCRHLRAGL